MEASKILHNIVGGDFKRIVIFDGDYSFAETKSGYWTRRIKREGRDTFFENSQGEKSIYQVYGKEERIISFYEGKFIADTLYIKGKKIHERTENGEEHNVYDNGNLVYSYRVNINPHTNDKTIYWEKFHYKNGVLLLKESSTGRTRKYKYNKANKVLSAVDDRGNTWKYKYDRKGYVIEEVTVYDKKISTKVYKYSNNYKRVVIESIDGASSSKVPWIREIEYDNFGNEILNSLKNGECQHGIVKHKYDDKNRLIEKSGEPTMYSKTEYRYDDRGNVIEEINDRIVLKYTFNEKNLLVKREIIENMRDFGFFGMGRMHRMGCECNCSCGQRTHEYKYNDDDKEILELFNGKKVKEIEYDSKGNKIKEIFYRENNNVFFTDTYEYDNEGNLIESTTFDDGEILTISVNKLVEKYNPTTEQIFELRKLLNF